MADAILLEECNHSLTVGDETKLGLERYGKVVKVSSWTRREIQAVQSSDWAGDWNCPDVLCLGGWGTERRDGIWRVMLGTIPFGVARQDEGFSPYKTGLPSSRTFPQVARRRYSWHPKFPSLSSSRLFSSFLFVLFTLGGFLWLCRPEQPGRRSTQVSHSPASTSHIRPHAHAYQTTDVDGVGLGSAAATRIACNTHAHDDSHHATFRTGEAIPTRWAASHRLWQQADGTLGSADARVLSSVKLRLHGASLCRVSDPSSHPMQDMFRLRLLTGMSTQ